MTTMYRLFSVFIACILISGCGDDSSPTVNNTPTYPEVETYTGTCGMNASAFVIDSFSVENVAFEGRGSVSGWPSVDYSGTKKYEYTEINIDLWSVENFEIPAGSTPQRLYVDLNLKVPGTRPGEFPWVQRTLVDTSSGSIKLSIGSKREEYTKFVHGKTIITKNEPDPFGDLNIVEGTYTGVFEIAEGKYITISGAFNADCP